MQIFITVLFCSLTFVLARHPCTIIESFNYTCQIIYVKTADNYILQVHRITHSPKLSTLVKKQPVLLTHGLLSSSAEWICMGPGRSLALRLADMNYDVWMANARGNAFSLNHTTLNPQNGKDKAKYFDFSWHEIGYFDNPAVIDHILAETNNEKLHYVGYSQGVTSFLVLASTRPEYNPKFASITLMAPSAIMGHQEWLRPVAALGDQLIAFLQRVGVYEFPLAELIRSLVLRGVCQIRMFQELCDSLMALDVGDSENVFWDKEIILLSENFPTSVSLKQLAHYGQLIRSRKEFLMYDYGPKKNMRMYGQAGAPPYDLENIKLPLAIFYGRTDFLAHFDDSKLLISKLPNVVKNYPVPVDIFSHFDFIMHRNIINLLLKPIEQYIEECEERTQPTIH